MGRHERTLYEEETLSSGRRLWGLRRHKTETLNDLGVSAAWRGSSVASYIFGGVSRSIRTFDLE